MAIYTPRGLKIRMPIRYAFGLIAKLYPRVSAFDVLKTAEGLDQIPKVLAFVACLTCFILKLHPLSILLYTLLASLTGTGITIGGLYVIPGLPSLAKAYSYVSGFAILLIGLCVVGFVLVGWQGVLAFFGAKVLAAIIGYPMEFLFLKRLYKQTGLPMTLSEINFLNAYRLHAAELGEPTDIALSDGELEGEGWKEPFEDLARKWPEVVARFTPD